MEGQGLRVVRGLTRHVGVLALLAVSAMSGACVTSFNFHCYVVFASPGKATQTVEEDVKVDLEKDDPAAVEAGRLTAAAQARNDAVTLGQKGSLDFSFTGADIQSVNCYGDDEGQPAIVYTPIFDNYPSFSRTGVAVAYQHPIGRSSALASRMFGQAAGSNGARSPLDLSLVARMDLARSDGFSSSFVGGLRVGKHLKQGFGVFGQGLAGVTHFTGENDFTFRPEGGVEFPYGGFNLVATVGFPIISFGNGFHERGFSVSGGISTPVANVFARKSRGRS